VQVQVQEALAALRPCPFSPVRGRPIKRKAIPEYSRPSILHDPFAQKKDSEEENDDKRSDHLARKYIRGDP